MRGVWDFMILTDKANLASNRLAYRCTRLYMHNIMVNARVLFDSVPASEM